MLEKEIKILDINQEEIIAKLEAFGAKRTFEGFVHDVYYDFPEEDENNKMEDNKRLFRVRKKGETHMYTIKRKRNKKKVGGEKGVKIADEGEREISDVESFQKVLDKYGMEKIREKKKFRISYQLMHLEFDIDDYYIGDNSKIIPPLLEIEARSKDELDVMVKKLELQDHRIETWGSRKLFEHYGQEYNYF
ncbi:CYTH domain-containing protein [Candidatus Gracilibacteria bacterium]|nr:CYTH domain-containing protein [Candidatus Gracilibacteria bacterium]